MAQHPAGAFPVFEHYIFPIPTIWPLSCPTNMRIPVIFLPWRRQIPPPPACFPVNAMPRASNHLFCTSSISSSKSSTYLVWTEYSEELQPPSPYSSWIPLPIRINLWYNNRTTFIHAAHHIQKGGSFPYRHLKPRKKPQLNIRKRTSPLLPVGSKKSRPKNSKRTVTASEKHQMLYCGNTC